MTVWTLRSVTGGTTVTEGDHPPAVAGPAHPRQLGADGTGARSARGADGRPVRVTAQYDLLRAGLVLHVDGRPVPSTGAVSREVGLGLLVAQFAVFVVGGMVGLLLAHAACDLAVAVLRCEGDRSVRRSQAATVAVAGACVTAAVVTLGALASRASGGPPILFGLLWSATG